MSTTLQRALLLVSPGAPLALGSRPVPKPGPGQLLVRIVATALNPIDALNQGTGFFVREYPAVIGSDAAGVVQEVGAGVSGFERGERV